MKKLLIPFCLLLIFAACGGNKNNNAENEADSTTIGTDSAMMDSAMKADILPTDDKENADMANMVIPAAADEVFYDFIGAFCNQKKYQVSRVKFPLVVSNDGNISEISKEQWNFTRLHYNDDAYTVFYPDDKSSRLEKDKNLNKVIVQQFDSAKVKNYIFEKTSGQWMLSQISINPLEKDADNSFVTFYNEFITNNEFAATHSSGNVTFSGVIDDEETYSTKKVKNHKISSNQVAQYVASLKDEARPGKFSNIDFGQNNSASKTRIVILEEPNGGSSIKYYFVQSGDSWELSKIEAM